MSTYKDGDYTVATQHGPAIRSLDPVTGATQYRVTMHQLYNNFTPLEIGTAGTGSSYLYEETEPKHLNGGIIEWDRLYTTVPPSREEAEGYIFTRQQVSLLIVPATGEIQRTLVEIAVPTTSIVEYSYHRTTEPSGLTVDKAFRLVQVGNTILSVGSTDMDTLTMILAEDSEISLYKPGIWQRKNRFVKREDIEVNEEA